MTQVTRLFGRALLGFGVGAAALLWNGQAPERGRMTFASTAEAWVGRPATPASYAGVARRTTRRAVVGTGAVATTTARTATAGAVATGAAVTGAAVTGAAAAGRCARVTGPYGRVVTVCR